MSKFSNNDIDEAEKQIYNLRKTVRYDIRELTIEIITQKYAKSLINDNSINDDTDFPYNSLYIPEYQRDFTWDEGRQSRFIESIILGLPIPLFFVAENQNGSWEIVDGSQRIRTLHSFVNDNLTLRSLDKLNTLNGFKFTDFYISRQNKIVNIPMRMIVLSEDATEETKKDMFERINRGSDLLKPMEKRKGIYIGDFNKFIYKTSSENEKFNTLAPIDQWLKNRQESEELLLRFFALSDNNTYAKFPERTGISSFLDEYLDSKNKQLEKMNTEEKNKHLAEYTNSFLAVLSFVDNHFPYGFRRTHNPQTKRSIFEAISVGVHVFLKSNSDLPPIANKEFIKNSLNSTEFKSLTSSNIKSHSPIIIRKRVEYILKMLSGKD